LYDGTTGKVKKVTKVGFNKNPKWSPKNSQIAFTSIREPHSRSELYLYDLKDGSVQRMTDIGGVSDIRWMPDGKSLLISDATKAGLKEWLLNISDKSLSSLKDSEYENIFDLSESSDNNERHDSFLPDAELDKYRIYPSPNNRHIFLHYRLKKMSVLLDKAQYEHIEITLPNVSAPAWSKDGSRLAFIYDSGIDYAELLIYNVDDKRFETYRILKGIGHACPDPPSWNAQGTAVIYSCGDIYPDTEEDVRDFWLYLYHFADKKNQRIVRGRAPDWTDKGLEDMNLSLLTESAMLEKLFLIDAVQGRVYRANLDLYDSKVLTLCFIFTEKTGRLYVRLLRNEIFARHGRAFKSEDLRQIFESTDWYKPDPNYSDDMLNDIERRNVQFILDYEKKMGWR
jgi:Tol biopolymer transport system component